MKTTQSPLRRWLDVLVSLGLKGHYTATTAIYPNKYGRLADLRVWTSLRQQTYGKHTLQVKSPWKLSVGNSFRRLLL